MPRARPTRLLAAFVTASIGGLVGMMLSSGTGDAIFFCLAILPAATGLAAYAVNLVRRPR